MKAEDMAIEGWILSVDPSIDDVGILVRSKLPRMLSNTGASSRTSHGHDQLDHGHEQEALDGGRRCRRRRRCRHLATKFNFAAFALLLLFLTPFDAIDAKRMNLKENDAEKYPTWARKRCKV